EDEFNRLKAAYLDTEPDGDVRREWRRGARQ
ncbi:MAG: hypothetical protein CFH40_01258, partial [Alphaproteobacteria bacterium MarineAlpha10_Bin3]